MCAQVLILLLLESRKFRSGMYKRLDPNYMSPFTIHIVYTSFILMLLLCVHLQQLVWSKLDFKCHDIMLLKRI